MSYIYKITNTINDKVYIGQTSYSLAQRFAEHCSDMNRRTHESRPLYAAMRKYGVQNFTISLVEECSSEEINQREQYWIGYYNSYHSGYNATYGGEGTLLYDHEKIIQRLQECPYGKEVAIEFGCCVDVIYDIAKANNIVLKNRGNENLKAKSKQVFQYDKQNKQLLRSFDSVADAAIWCLDNSYASGAKNSIRSHIGDCANHKRKSAYGFLWSYEML